MRIAPFANEDDKIAFQEAKELKLDLFEVTQAPWDLALGPG